jgi:hypothetical protein
MFQTAKRVKAAKSLLGRDYSELRRYKSAPNLLSNYSQSLLLTYVEKRAPVLIEMLGSPSLNKLVNILIKL